MAKLLLVEDDNNLREIYEARLSAEGYEIATAQNGEEALSLAKQNHPDLIISDVMMPRISGFEMLDILRNTDELKNTKVIMLTALGQTDDRGRADNLGADKYLVKSQVTLEDIVNAAKALLSGNASSVDEVPAVASMTLPEPATPLTQLSETNSSSSTPESSASTTAPIPTPNAFTSTNEAFHPASENAPDVSAQSVTSSPIEFPVVEAAASITPSVEPLDHSVSAATTTQVISPVQPVLNDQAMATNSDQADASQASMITATDQTVQDSDDQAVTDAPQATTVSVSDPDPITPHISPVAEQIDYTSVTTPVAVEIPEQTAPQPASFETEDVIQPATNSSEAIIPETPAETEENPADPVIDNDISDIPSEETQSSEQKPMSTEPQSLADEEAAIEAQIAAFAQTTEEPAVEDPMPTVAEAEPITAQAANDAILSEAIAKLVTPTNAGDNEAEKNTPMEQPDPSSPVIITPKPEAETPDVPPTENDITSEVAPPETTAAERRTQVPIDDSSAAGQQSISGRKIIQPLSRSDEITPKLDKLLALEEAKEATDQLPTPMVGTVDRPVQPNNKPSIDPNSIAL